MKKDTALKKAFKMASDVIKGKLAENFLWSFCYENNISMCEIWNDDDTDIIGFGIEDTVFYY